MRSPPPDWHERDTGRSVAPSQLTVGQYLLDVWLPDRRSLPGDGGRGRRGRLGVQTWQQSHEAMRR